ncbi:MAG TPA: bifunctional riboflavin kinase/FMN adenylyltransferase, partial [Bacteroidetes bacterium]|nr:bifunctional riboflavin kinase/FMN adenylyltransferase [Bacteroidota bacterium]
PFLLDGEPVKSSRIRRLLEEGRVREAAKLLGRPYEIWGTVTRGKGRGRQFRFPTANLQVDDPHKLIPASGIYAGRALVRGAWYDAAVSIGIRPTFDETNLTIEAFILRFNDSIYGEAIRLQLIDKLRDEKKFDSVAALIEQMEKDVEEVQTILNAYQN